MKQQQRRYFQENSGNGDGGGAAGGVAGAAAGDAADTTTGTNAVTGAVKEKTVLESVHDELSSILAGIENAEHDGVDALKALLAKIKAAV